MLDVRARTITDGMALAAADALAGCAERLGISEVRIVPRMDEWKLYPHVAAAVGVRAQEQSALSDGSLSVTNLSAGCKSRDFSLACESRHGTPAVT